MECKHCKDSIGKQLCSICKNDIEDECMTCHKELAHDIIKVQNIHIVGGRGNIKTDGIDNDPDMYQPSWIAGN